MRLRTAGVVTAMAAVTAAGAFGVTGGNTIVNGAGAGAPGSAPDGGWAAVARPEAAPVDRQVAGWAASGNFSVTKHIDPIIAAVPTPAILAPADVIVGEADGFVDLVVRLADEGTNTVEVSYSTFNSTAAAGSGCSGDYRPSAGTLTFAPGEMSKVVRVDIFDCADVEGFETFTFALSTPVSGTIGRASARIGIVNNGTVVTTPRLFVRDAVVDEKAGTALVSVLLGGPAGQASSSTVTVDYETTDGTATGGADYTGSAGTLTFAPGQTAKTVAVSITDDVAPEPSESFALDLSNATNATIADDSGVVLIGPSDAAPAGQPSILATVDRVVGEADGFVDLMVSLSSPSANPVSVSYSTFNSTAAAGNGCSGDYVGEAGPLVFAPGETTRVVRTQILDCGDLEGFQTFTFGLSANSAIARSSGRIGIVNNGAVVTTPRLFVRDAVVDEKAGTSLVSVLLGGPAGEASNDTVTVDYATSDGTATAGADYTQNTGTLTFAPGETAKTVAVAIADDAGVEPSEDFGLGLSSPSGATIADGSGTVRIGASDGLSVPLPLLLAPTDVVVGESDGFVDLVVSLSAPGQNTVSVSWSTFNSTAAAGNGCSGDYVGEAGSLKFAPGETIKVVRVQIVDCPTVAGSEGFETFTFGLSAEANAVIARPSGRIGIVNNASVVATPRVFVRDAVVDEKSGFALVSVLLGGPAGQASNDTVTVDYATSNGTATAGADFTGAAGTLSFEPGETAKTVMVAIADDATAEPSESFALGLSNPSGATIADGSGVIVIGASDALAAPLPSILAPTDLIVGEGDGFVDLTLRLSSPGQNTVSVSWSTFNSTAAAGNGCDGDYVGEAGSVKFAPGETTKVVRIQILDCLGAEAFQSFTLALSAAVNGAIARASGRISIVDNGSVVATPTLHVRDAVVDEKDGSVLISVLLGGPRGQASNDTVTVDYATANATAIAGADFTGAAGTLSFAPGETAKTLVVAIADDAAIEAAEAFTLGLSNPTNATIADGSGTVVIGASDANAAAVPGIFAPADVIVGELDGYVDLVVNLSAPGQNTVSVNYSTFNETAASGNACNGDYVGHAGVLVFAPGETTKVVRVQIVDCPIIEGPETFKFQLSSATNGAISRVSGRVTILDGTTGRTLTGIAVTPANPSIAVGADSQFTATGTFSDASTADLTDSVTWASGSAGVASISAGGLAHGLGAGTSTISATLGALSGSTVLTVVAAGLSSQSITFAALADKTFGSADFTVSATASSGLPVSFTAGGNCTVSGATVHITGAGSCTITASQPGNASYAPAPSVSRTFSIAKASQTISFAALANRKLGDPDFTVRATASSGLPVAFAARGSCSISGARVHLTGAGSCTVTASQPGNANYTAAPAVSRTFSIGRQTQPLRCRVPRVISKQLATAKATIKQRHCRTGKVTRVYSRAKRKGVVIGQSRRPGRVLPANSKINLTVSRGRRR